MATFGKRHEAEQEQLERLAGGGTIRTALAFCIFGLLVAMAMVPVLSDGTQHLAGIVNPGLSDPIDTTVTGSVKNTAQRSQQQGTVRYTIRRSVMHKNPSQPCYIYEDGTRRDDC